MPNNIIEFKSLNNQRSNIVFCLVDNTVNCASSWIKEIVMNQAEYTISNVVGKFYDLFQGMDEDDLLRHVTELGYQHAVMLATGTEFINGYSFFEEIEKLANTDVALVGHILDRKDAYYEIHHQCYFVNLQKYKEVSCPSIGQQQLGVIHQQYIPDRSVENYHDDYTPTWIEPGSELVVFNHQCHGWNILSKFLENNFKIAVFDQTLRNSKIHLYPEYINDFNKNVSWIYKRQQVCLSEFIHTSNTEWDFKPDLKFKQIVTPASGIWYHSVIDTAQPTTVIFYDYNKQSLDYWKNTVPEIKNISYKFVLLDLLIDNFDIRNLIDIELAKDTIINFSNIFFYEGTACLFPLNYRLSRENKIINNIKAYADEAYISINMRSSGAFAPRNHLHGELDKAKNISTVECKSLIKPTWRFNQDWL